ncbi:MAG: hypothetical protein ACP6KW_03450 [Candidatus Thorarchaeota archaeon]
MDAEELLAKYMEREDRLADASSPSDVFSRQFGAEMTKWERDLIADFKTRLAGSKYQFRGFVHHTQDPSTIVLTASPWLLNGEPIYLPEDLDPPPDGALVEIVGRRIASPFHLQHSKKVREAILAEDVRLMRFDVSSAVTPPMSLRDLSALLFEHVGMAEASKRVFARLFVSSPPYQNSVGGLTTGIQAIASKRQVRRFMSFVRNVLPPALRAKSHASAKIGGLIIRGPRLWRMDVGSVHRSRLEALCINRRDPSGFREVSVGALTKPDTATLPDVPLALASEDFWIETSDPTQLRLPILKSAITYQLMTPKVTSRSIDAGTKHVLGRLETLRESFGLDDSALARGGVLDADAMGRPLSVLRLARSTARASWDEKVSSRDLKTAWNRVLEPALKEFLELSELKRDSERDWGVGSRFDRFNTKVLRAIRKLDPGTRGSLGPTLQEVADEAGVEPHVAAETLARMKDSGVLYEPRPGHYRLV